MLMASFFGGSGLGAGTVTGMGLGGAGGVLQAVKVRTKPNKENK
ncbi:hypothetical protein [Oceanisphaera ostreae]